MCYRILLSGCVLLRDDEVDLVVVHRYTHRKDAGERARDVLLVHAVERHAPRRVLLRERFALLLDVADVVLRGLGVDGVDATELEFHAKGTSGSPQRQQRTAMRPVWLKTPLISARAASHSSFVRAVFSASYGRSNPLFFTSSSSKCCEGIAVRRCADGATARSTHELGNDDLVEALELGAVREVGLLFFFFLGLLLGFRRCLVGFLVGPTRALARWDVSTLEDAATRCAMINHSAHETCGRRRVRSFGACLQRSALAARRVEKSNEVGFCLKLSTNLSIQDKTFQ